MKKLLLIIALAFSAGISYSQQWLWGVQPASGKANVDDEGWALASDKSGNMYITGWFGDTAVFGKDTLKTPGSSLYTTDVFLAKYNENGKVLWAKQSVGEVISRGNGYSVATDKSNNVYVTGCFQDTLNFGSYQLKGFSTYFYVFLVKYDSNGTVLWATQSANTSVGNSFGVSVSIDSKNNVFVTGNYQDNVAFGTYKLTTPTYGSNVFLTKYDSNGNVLWATAPAYGTQCNAEGYSVTTDVSGNAYITGRFEYTASFGSSVLTATTSGSDAYFLAKYNGTGSPVWAKQSYSGTNATRGYALTTDAAGYIYTTGIYSGSAVIGTATLPNAVKENTFLARYDTAGNLKWIRSGNVLDNNAWLGLAVTTDIYCNSYIAVGTGGGSNSQIEFGSDVFSINNSTDPLLLVKYDSAGNEQCGTIIASGGDDFCGIATDKKGNLYVGGDLEDTVTFGTDKIGPQPNAAEWVFFAKWQPCNKEAQGINQLSKPNDGVTVYPNPSNGIFNLQLGIRNYESKGIEIYNMLGKKVLSQFVIPNSEFVIDLQGQPAGVYLYRVTDSDGNCIGSGKLVKE